ncbi:Phosphodiesterase I [Handroanthus impetiginosus]|uniref:Phosphodiesterase I n=1 Tax=Handroanthus impetiginosus TaxID=429701 RepID=A0A2G9GAI5_9LAMI|nr:Phosphodiesterase I [Handroanthus impetiginosus]
MFRFCIADTEHDWREGSEQYNFIEHCLPSVDRRKQPWLIFAAHRVLGYSSAAFYANEGSFAEPMGRDDLQKLWQKHKVEPNWSIFRDSDYGFVKLTAFDHSNLLFEYKRSRDEVNISSNFSVVVALTSPFSFVQNKRSYFVYFSCKLYEEQ